MWTTRFIIIELRSQVTYGMANCIEIMFILAVSLSFEFIFYTVFPLIYSNKMLNCAGCIMINPYIVECRPNCSLDYL
jgi:hypothetical protein